MVRLQFKTKIFYIFNSISLIARRTKVRCTVFFLLDFPFINFRRVLPMSNLYTITFAAGTWSRLGNRRSELRQFIKWLDMTNVGTDRLLSVPVSSCPVRRDRDSTGVQEFVKWEIRNWCINDIEYIFWWLVVCLNILTAETNWRGKRVRTHPPYIFMTRSTSGEPLCNSKTGLRHKGPDSRSLNRVLFRVKFKEIQCHEQ